MASNERAIINNLNERARHFGGSDAPQLTIHDVRAVLDFYHRTCLNCGKTPATSVDHVIPLSKGGENKVSNTQVLCSECNKAKGTDSTDYRLGNICPQPQPEQRTYRKHDWDAIEHEYVTTEASLREIAERFGVNDSNVLDRAAAGHWRLKRKNYGVKLGSEVQAEVLEQAKAEGVQAVLQTARVVQSAIERWEYDGSKGRLGEIVDALKLLAAMQGQTTERVAQTDETDLNDDDIVHAAERVARRADRQAEKRYSRGSPEDEDGAGAGWTD